jgi:uncharacterized protein YjiS (DUF1127 family)
MTPSIHIDFRSAPTRVSRLGIGIGTAFGVVWRAAQRWVARSRERHALARLDARLLRDIGLNRAAAAKEAAKPFWRR